MYSEKCVVVIYTLSAPITPLIKVATTTVRAARTPKGIPYTTAKIVCLLFSHAKYVETFPYKYFVLDQLPLHTTDFMGKARSQLHPLEMQSSGPFLKTKPFGL